MAVSLDSITPSDGATEVSANLPIVAALSDATDMDVDLVEIVVDGVSHTVANGKLDYWSVRTVSVGAYVDDLTSVTFATIAEWFTFSGAEITVVVNYNSSPISSTSFTATEYYLQESGHANWLYLQIAMPQTAAMAHYEIVNWGTDRCAAPAYYQVLGYIVSGAFGHYYVAHPTRTSMPTSAVVGTPIGDTVPASAVVQALVGQKAPASAIVQGFFRQGMPASAITGIAFRHGESMSAIVGEEVLQKIPASAVVYAVLRDSVLEVSVIDPGTKTLLESLGVTFS